MTASLSAESVSAVARSAAAHRGRRRRGGRRRWPRDVAGRAGVADVRYDRRWLARLLASSTGARVAGAVVAGILMLGAAFTVAAVVRLSLYARRDELDIMQLVGAPFSYIRGPFVVEGLLLGGIGAAVALVAIAILYSTLVGGGLGRDLAGLAGAGQLRFLGDGEIAIMLLGGVGGRARPAVARRAQSTSGRCTSVDTLHDEPFYTAS